MSDASASGLRAPTIHSADHPGRGYTCTGSRLLDEWAHGEPHGITEACARLAEACGVTRQLVSTWRNEKRPAPKHWATIARVTNLEPRVWETWELLGAPEPEAPPESEKRTTEPAQLGTTKAELLETVRQIDRALGGSLADGARANLLGKRTSALVAVSRLEERGELEDHPDYDAHLELVLDALEATLEQYGVVPGGARTAFVDHYERLEAKRQRRAA